MCENAIIYYVLEPHDADFLLFAMDAIRLLATPGQEFVTKWPSRDLFGPFLIIMTLIFRAGPANFNQKSVRV